MFVIQIQIAFALVSCLEIPVAALNHTTLVELHSQIEGKSCTLFPARDAGGPRGVSGASRGLQGVYGVLVGILGRLKEFQMSS